VPLPQKLLDVFSSKTNLNLVLEFLDTDLEMIIKDRSLVFLPADIKSWMAMTFRGLEFCHRNFILHRVRKVSLPAHPRALQKYSFAYRASTFRIF
jgi:serine/threonine protein kinase